MKSCMLAKKLPFFARAGKKTASEGKIVDIQAPSPISNYTKERLILERQVGEVTTFGQE